MQITVIISNFTDLNHLKPQDHSDISKIESQKSKVSSGILKDVQHTER